MIIRYYYFIFWLFAFIDSLLLVKDRQESGRERRGETCSKGFGERDSNTQLAVRPEPIICAYALTPRPSRRTPCCMFKHLFDINMLNSLCQWISLYRLFFLRVYKWNQMDPSRVYLGSFSMLKMGGIHL